jgi:hypothetical protein
VHSTQTLILKDRDGADDVVIKQTNKEVDEKLDEIAGHRDQRKLTGGIQDPLYIYIYTLAHSALFAKTSPIWPATYKTCRKNRGSVRDINNRSPSAELSSMRCDPRHRPGRIERFASIEKHLDQEMMMILLLVPTVLHQQQK